MKVIPKYQFGNKTKKQNYEWTRLRTAKGYVYAKTRNGQAIEYSPNGFFRVYEKPDSNSHSYETTFENAGEGNIPSVQRKPDNHAAAVAQQKEIDEKVDAITPGAEDLFTAGTLGGMNNLSPTQWVRRAYDLGEAIKGNMSWDNFGNSWFYGNNGVLSDEYARENPNAAMAINLAGDVAAFGGAGLLRRMPTYSRMMQAEDQLVKNVVADNWKNLERGSIGYDVRTGPVSEEIAARYMPKHVEFENHPSNAIPKVARRYIRPDLERVNFAPDLLMSDSRGSGTTIVKKPNAISVEELQPEAKYLTTAPPSEYSPRQLSDGRYVINDPDNPGKSILWDKYLEKTGQGQIATNLGYNPQQIAEQATKDFNNSILQRVINEDKLLSDLADKIKSGKATTQFATGRRTIVNPSPRDVLAGEYLDATKGKQVRGVGLVNTTPVEVTTTGEEVYAGRGNFGVNSFSVTNSKRASTKYGAIDYEKLTNDTQHSKVLTDQEKNEVFDIMKRMKEIDKNPLPKMEDNTQGKFKVTPEEELEYISLGERLNELVPGTFEYGAKNRHILFRAPEERQILDISSTNNNFGYQKETLGLNLFDYRNAPVKSYTPAGNLKSGNFGNMVDAERTIGGYYKDSSLYGRQLVKGWNQSDKVMELLKLRYPHLFPLRIPKNYRFYVRGTGPNGVSGDVDMITLQAPNGGVPGFKFGNKLNYYKKWKFKF